MDNHCPFKKNINMFEFDTEKEAKEAYEKIQGYKILAEMVFYDQV